MNEDNPLREMFRRLADALPEQPTLVDSVMRRIEDSAAKPLPRKTRRWFLGATLGTAACLALCFLAWFIPFFALTPAVTFAQVQTALAAQKWMHVKYDDGREFWTTMDGMKEFHIEQGGYIVAFDHSKNLDLRYQPHSGYIEKLSYNHGWKPKTVEQIVGFSMDLPEGETTGKKKGNAGYMERFADTLDGRHMARFDQYRRDLLGKSRLQRQIWVDPTTRLPIRVQMFLPLGLRKDPQQEYTIGNYDFSDHGPENIYALGVPRNLSIVEYPEKTSEAVAKVIESAQLAHDQFPTRYRFVIWPEKEYSNIHLIYRNGMAVKAMGEKTELNATWSGVKVSQANYSPNFDIAHSQDHLPLSATAEQVVTWTRKQKPVGLNVSDGKRAYSKTAPFPHYARPSMLQIFPGEYCPFNTTLWPTHTQWPVVSNSGPYTFAPSDVEPMPPGTIVLRSERGNRRNDFYLDPAHDYICLRWLWWEKRGDIWAKDRDESLSGLKQLPDGQWFATKKHLKSYGNPQRGIVGHETSWNQDIQILKEDEFPPDAFNGEKILEESKKDGTIIDAQ